MAYHFREGREEVGGRVQVERNADRLDMSPQMDYLETLNSFLLTNRNEKIKHLSLYILEFCG